MIAMTASSSPLESFFHPRIFGARPFHTDGELLALRFAPDGSLWSVEEPGVVRWWDLNARRQIVWHELADPATVWCFSASAHYLAAGSDELCLWESNKGELLACWSQASWVTALAFQPGGLLLASGHDDGVVRLWDYAGGRLAYELRGPISPSQSRSGEPSRTHFAPRGSRRQPEGGSAISALAFSPDGRKLAVAAEDRSILLWDMRNGELLGCLLGHTDRIPSLAWHPDGRRLVSAGWDATARVWDTVALLPLILLNSHVGQVQALAFAPHGRLLACADSAPTVHLWDMELYQTLTVRRDHAQEVRCLAFSPDGRCLASGGAGRVIHIWDADHDSMPQEAIDPLLARTCLAVSGDGRRLASLGIGTNLRVWDTAMTEPVLELEDNPKLRAFAASPDDRWFAGSVVRPEGAQAARETLFLWRAHDGRRERRLDGQAAPITVLAFHPGSTLLATAGMRSSDVWLWTIPQGEPLLLPEIVAECSVEALAFHPGGRVLAIGGIDWLAPRGAEGRLVLWDLLERRSIAILPGGTSSLSFHPSGRYLAAATLMQSVVVWDVETHRQVVELTGHLDAVTSVAYSPDGRWLASGGDDRTLRIWHADSGRPCGLMELDTQIKALTFAPDGGSLFTGNGTTSCYQIEIRHILAGRSG
jgi:WD40 repeat protein